MKVARVRTVVGVYIFFIPFLGSVYHSLPFFLDLVPAHLISPLELRSIFQLGPTSPGSISRDERIRRAALFFALFLTLSFFFNKARPLNRPSVLDSKRNDRVTNRNATS